MDKKELLKARKKAYKMFLLSGRTDYKYISQEVGLTVEQLKHYREKDVWDERKERDVERGVVKKQVSKQLKKTHYEAANGEEIDELQKILDESGITDRQQLFVMYYLQSYNSSQSAAKAGYSRTTSHVRGNEQLNKPKVAETITKIKKLMHSSIYFRTQDIIEEYIKIANADMKDFMEFDNGGVRLKPSNEVDGKLIVEVKQGRDGVTIKLADKMKALEKLEKFFEMMPDKANEIALKRLTLEENKFEFAKRIAEDAGDKGSNVTIVNDIR